MSFEDRFNEFIPELTESLSIPGSPDWSVKGFIDYYQNIYSISIDTKVVSKIIELMIFPKFLQFATRHGYTLKLSPHQNYYPDITFIDNAGKKYAVDLKSTYRVSSTEVNGMTLGAFTGYFRDRTLRKNVLYPYGEYEEHYVFGIIYSRTDITRIEEYLSGRALQLNTSQRKKLIIYINECTDEKWNDFTDICSRNLVLNGTDRLTINSYLINETNVYNLDNFTTIQSVVRDFQFFIQEKWKIAIARPGSGNTKNIGSESNIANLISGNGVFIREFEADGKRIFDNYWMNYLTKDMARAIGIVNPPYNNLESYRAWVSSLRIE